MLGLDLAEDEIDLFDAKWRIRFIPVAKYEEITDRVSDAFESYREHLRANHRAADGKLDPPKDCDACTQAVADAEKRMRPVYRDIVRWGLVSTSAPGVTLPREPVDVDGRTYEVLTAEIVERLCHVARGQLVSVLGDRILSANELSPREALGFR